MAPPSKRQDTSSSDNKPKRVPFSNNPLQWDARQISTYGKFIKLIRSLLTGKVLKVRYKGRVHIFRQLAAESENNRFLDVKILLDDKTYVCVRIRRCNLYILGYSDSADNWFEFSDQDLMLPDSEEKPVKKLSFTGSYTKLGKPDQVKSLGMIQFINALHKISKTERPNDETEYKSYLATLIVMIAESARFGPVAVDVVLWNRVRFPELFTIWGHLSQTIINVQDEEDCGELNLHGWSLKQCERRMGILNSGVKIVKSLGVTKAIRKSKSRK